MSSKPVCLFEAVPVPAASETEVYESPARTLSLVEKFIGHNTNTVALLVIVKIIAAGDTPGADNIFAKRTLLPDESYGFPEVVGNKLAPGDSISVLADVTGLNVRGSGTQVAV